MTKQEKRDRRRKKIRAKIKGTSDAPRLAVYRSNKYVYAELIDDELGVTLAASSSFKLDIGTTLEKARKVGQLIAESAGKQNIKKAVFDRAGFIFTGKIKAVAEGAREGGLKF